MVKGISRRVIVIKSPDPELFDEAIFLVREDALKSGKTQSDILKQAQRAANEYIRSTVTEKPKKSPKPWLFAAAGSLLTALIWAITYFI